MDPDPELLFLSLASLDTMSILGIIALLLLLICSALISGTEVAFFSLSQTDLDELSEESKGNHPVVKLLEKPKKLLATILITNNFINILIVLLFASLGELFFSDFDYSINLYFLELPLRFLIEVVLITFLILLFGEVLPKVYASRRALRFSNFMVKPVRFLNALLTPLRLSINQSYRDY